MAVANLGRVKRREKILLVIAVAVAFFVYRSASVVATLDPATVGSMGQLRPLWVDGRVMPGLVLLALGELFQLIAGLSLVYGVAYSAIGFGVLTCILVYFISRELFGQRYVSVVARARGGPARGFVDPVAGKPIYVVSLFFVALAVYAWLRQRPIIWGFAAGLAFSSHFAAALLVVPFLSWVWWSRRSLVRPWTLVAGALIAVLVAGVSYFWMLSSAGGPGAWMDARLWPAFRNLVLPTLGVEFVAYLAVYVAAALTLCYLFRGSRLVRRGVVAVAAVGVPFTFLLIVNGQPIFDAAGNLLWTLALISVLPLHLADGKRREFLFVLCWLVPLLLLVPLGGRNLGDLLLFALLPMALLACRLLDRTLAGEWLDYWWAFGLPSNWYYRLGKLAVLLVVVLSIIQASQAQS